MVTNPKDKRVYKYLSARAQRQRHMHKLKLTLDFLSQTNFILVSGPGKNFKYQSENSFHIIYHSDLILVTW